MRTLFITVFLLAFSGAVFAVPDAAVPTETGEGRVDGFVGRPVPSFQAGTVSGTTVSPANFGGRVLLIDLWGLTCVSCLEELKALEEVYRDYRDKGFAVWAVNTEMIDANEIVEGLSSRDVEVSYHLLTDPELAVTRKFTQWFIPVTVIVDADGIVQYYKVGFKKEDVEVIRAKVEALLEE